MNNALALNITENRRAKPQSTSGEFERQVTAQTNCGSCW